MDGDAYKVFLVLHIVAVVVGFGSFSLAGLYGRKAAERGGREGLALVEVGAGVTENWASWFIYAVPVFGIILILLSDDVIKFSQAWISTSFLLWFVAVGVMHGAYFPSLRRMKALMAQTAAGDPTTGPPAREAGQGPPAREAGQGPPAREAGQGPPAREAGQGPPPQVGELERLETRAAVFGGVINLLWVVVLVLMIWQPGGPASS